MYIMTYTWVLYFFQWKILNKILKYLKESIFKISINVLNLISKYFLEYNVIKY